MRGDQERPPPRRSPVAVNNNVIELRMGTSWMNASSFIEYIKLLFSDPVTPSTILLIFGSARCHAPKDVKEYLANKEILYAIISGGMTGFCQLANFGRFAQLKNQLSKSIGD